MVQKFKVQFCMKNVWSKVRGLYRPFPYKVSLQQVLICVYLSIPLDLFFFSFFLSEGGQFGLDNINHTGYPKTNNATDNNKRS